MLILKQTPMELKSIIGKRTTEHGQLVRMNRIALEQIKSVLQRRDRDDQWKRRHLDAIFADGYTNEQILSFAMRNFAVGSGCIELDGIDVYLYVAGYKTDYRHGLCEDGDCNCVRLVKDDGKVIKKKIGKVVREHLDRPSCVLCDQAKTYVCEHVAQLWKAYAAEHVGDETEYDLVVDGNFAAIYDSDMQVGNFHSCMNGCSGIGFYNEIDASAASLRNADGMVVARCVVFNDVHDFDGNTYRYAERQYSSDTDLSLQQQLINRLYAEGYIDLNKRVGTGCWNHDDVVDRNGNAFRRVLYIEHCFEDRDPCPFMDGFSYYDKEEERLYNTSGYGETELTSTNGYVELMHRCDNCGSNGEVYWSSYFDCEVCDNCGVYSDTLSDWLLESQSVRVYNECGDDDWMPEDYDGRYGFTWVESADAYYFDDCVCFDEINEEDILYKNSVEYNYYNGGRWYQANTHIDEIGLSIIKFDDEYWLMEDCEEVDGVWYPFDQVPEEIEEEALLGVA